jgi:protein-tyrosine phosphatase
MNTLKQSAIKLFGNSVTLLRDSNNTMIVPKIYLSDAPFIQDPTNLAQWINLNIGLIINVTTDNLASFSLKNMYKQHNISYLEMPIQDTDSVPSDQYFLQILEAVTQFQNKKTGRNILVHCSAGINRSALVAAILLWYTTPGRHNFWPTAQILIEYMRKLQRIDRSLPLLMNVTFESFLITRLK